MDTCPLGHFNVVESHAVVQSIDQFSLEKIEKTLVCVCPPSMSSQWTA
jgi:hypothetical protein